MPCGCRGAMRIFAAGLGRSERAQEACVAVEARVAQGYADDSVLLAAVRHGVALARGGAQLAADVVVVDALGQDLVEPVIHVGAGSHVLRLLLNPDDLLQARVAGEQLDELLLRERVQQLYARDRDVPRGLPLFVADDVVVDLHAAQHEPCDLLALPRQRRVVEYQLEAAAGELLGSRDGRGVAQQRLRRHHYQRPLLRDQRLASQHVEVLRRRGQVRHADVALGAQLQEALQAATRVLRARALVAVRQQERQARGLSPFGQTRGDELIDDHLRAVHEVAELRPPEDERLRRLHRVAILEPERGLLRQRRVVQLERSLRGRDVLDRRVALARARVVEDQVALAERAALDVLAGQADRHALDQKRRVCERLGVPPLEACALRERLTPFLDLRLELAVDREALRHLEQHLVETGECLATHPSGRLHAPAAIQLVLAGIRAAREHFLQLGVRRRQTLVATLRELVGLLL